MLIHLVTFWTATDKSLWKLQINNNIFNNKVMGSNPVQAWNFFRPSGSPTGYQKYLSINQCLPFMSMTFSTFNNTTSYLLITKLNKNVIATIASISSADSKAVIFKQKGWKKTSIQTFWALLCTDWIFNFEKTNSYCLVSTFLMIRFSLYI